MQCACDQFFSSSLDCLTKFSMVTSIIHKFCREQLMNTLLLKVHKQTSMKSKVLIQRYQ